MLRSTFDIRHSTDYLSSLIVSWSSVDHARDLTIRQRRRQWKRRWKIDFASFETFSPLYQVTQLLESTEVRLELKRGDRVRVQTERESKVYCLAVPALKSTQNLVISRPSSSGTAKKFTKKCVARDFFIAELAVKSNFSSWRSSWTTATISRTGDVSLHRQRLFDETISRRLVYDERDAEGSFSL